MKRTLLCIVFMATGIFLPQVNAQTANDILKKVSAKEKRRAKLSEEEKKYYERVKQNTIDALEQEKQNIAETEKFELKKQLEKIDERLEKGNITQEKATALKQEAAKKSALNIDNRVAIIDNQIALAKRDVQLYDYKPATGAYIALGFGNVIDDKGSFLLGIDYKGIDKKPKYDKRTYTDVVFAFGPGGTTGGGTELGGNYKVWKSGFAEIGFTFRTRLLKDSNFWRLAYGISYQQNQFSPKDNKYFVNNNGYTALEVFPHQIKRNRLILDNIVILVFIEFGPSKKREYKDYFRYDTSQSFKVGIGGFAGINTGAMQWMKYVEDGNDIKVKTRQDYNVEKFVYGLKGYVGFGSLSLFANYELNTVFSNSANKDHALYFGFRVDL